MMSFTLYRFKILWHAAWHAHTHFLSKVDGFVPRSQVVNLRKVPDQVQDPVASCRARAHPLRRTYMYICIDI